jgi:hypothetical protein
MSDLAKHLFDRLKQIGPEVVAEAKRQGELGASEIAAAFFKGADPFVLYGPAQRGRNVEQEQSLYGHSDRTHESQQEHEPIERNLSRER